MHVDLNADVGESFGAFSIGDDEALLASITSASVAAGLHAGDPSVLRQTIRSARRRTALPSAPIQACRISLASAAGRCS